MPFTAVRPARLLLALLIAAACAAAPRAIAEPSAEAPSRLEAVPVFERPALQRELRGAAILARRGDLVGAELALRRAAAEFPRLGAIRFALARFQARRGDPDQAAESLRAAAEGGVRGAERLHDPVFAALREREDFAGIETAFAAPPPPEQPLAPPAVPAPLSDGAAVLSESNSEWSDAEQAVRAYFAAPAEEDGPGLVVQGGGEAALRLNRLFAAGRAAGNRGDFYENRDDEHSMLDLDRFAQITPVEHGPAAAKAGFGRGLSQGLALSAGVEAPPLIANSSTAVVAETVWRSLARLALTEPGHASELWRQYASNQIHIYPEHKDHDPFFGDVFPANTPYFIVSQGSSYSDRRAMESVAMILAAFRPETKERLIEERLIAPTVQMIWRRGQEGVTSDEAYLSPRAHPTVFDPGRAEPLRMVELANALEPGEVPPLVRLEVLQESRPTPGVTLFGDGLSETLFDTPSAVARILRGTERTKRLTVSAAGTQDPNGRELRFRWVLLRGDPERVRIRPLGERGEGAEIEVDWHETTEAPLSSIRSQRADVAVFAHNGAQWSAPAFVSVAFPPRQRRSWDKEGRL
ncbi:MAG: hypothetical protein ACQEUZ_13530, partial [Pseudomonadota bacterium]